MAEKMPQAGCCIDCFRTWSPLTFTMTYKAESCLHLTRETSALKGWRQALIQLNRVVLGGVDARARILCANGRG